MQQNFGNNNNNPSYLQGQRTGYPGQSPMGGVGMGGGGMGMGMGMSPGMGPGMGMTMQPTGFQSSGGGGYGTPMGMGMQGLSAQPTGYISAGGGGGMGMQSQPTGMGNLGSVLGRQGGGGTSGFSPNPTGGGALNSNNTGSYGFLNSPAPPPPMPMHGNQSFNSGVGGGSRFGSGLTSQPTGFSGSGGLTHQMTGYPTGGGLQPQPTGMPHDPRLQMMAASFMPSNLSQPFSSSGIAQFAHPTSQPLPQTFNSLLSNPSIATPKVPWTLSRQEKKDYDQIFRAWTGGDGGGYIDGSMAQDVFGQSGLSREDMGKIWNLADVNDRGKLNLPEFHVAMGLIYRALNGNPIPDQLPPEMIPPSMRDIDSTVDFVKDLLRNDNTNSARSSPAIDLPGTYSSRNNNNGQQPKDATVYKHDDTRAKGYQSSNRHLDRKAVRYDGEDSSAELDSIKRDLENSSRVLEKSATEFAQRTEEDERLEAELDELKYRVRRVKDDIEFVSRGKRTEEKDEERRKLERELLFLMHEKLPEVEKKIEEREERKRREDREGIKARDKRNDTYGRYGDRDRYERDRPRYDDRPRYEDRERERERERGDRDRYDDRNRDRDGDRERERDHYDDRDRFARRPASPPPAPPSEPSQSAVAAPPPAPPKPKSVTTSAPSTKNMTPEERSEFIRKQARERLAARMKALGMAGPDTDDTPTVDTSVSDRLERERKEAEEKSKAAEREQEEREAARNARLQQAGVPVNDDKKPAPPTPQSAAKKSAPPPPKPRSVAPPPPAAPKAPAARPVAKDEVDPEEEEMRRQEEAHKKAMAERQARLQRMREEEEAAQRAEEEMLRKRQEAQKQREREAATTEKAVEIPPKVIELPSSPPNTTVKSPSGAAAGSTNPFHRMQGNAASPGSAGFNPFLKPKANGGAASSPPASSSPATTPSAAPAVEAARTPSAPSPALQQQTRSAATIAPRPSFAPPEEEWDVIGEKEANDSDDDSSDDDYAGSRSKRGALAAALFGGGGSKGGSNASTPPPVNKAALTKLGGSTPADPNTRASLFASIQGGARLKKAVTHDRSAVAGVGHVLGDAAPPPHIKSQPKELVAEGTGAGQDENENDNEPASQRSNRDSVDWYAGLAADADRSHVSEAPQMDSVHEDAEVEGRVDETTGQDQAASPDGLEDFDLTKTLRVRSLYAFDAQRDVEVSFPENVVLEAHPAKDPSSAWWYGTYIADGKTGWFPSNYVQEIHPKPATALFPYTGTSPEELPFEEGDTLSIVDHSEDDWWKAEKDGVIFIVPAAYLELIGTTRGNPGVETAATEMTAAATSSEKEVVASPTVPVVAKMAPETPQVSVSHADANEGPADASEDESDDALSEASSEDSALSFWEDDTDEEAAAHREDARQRAMDAAGLKLRREPPGIPPKRPEPRRRRAPPSIPLNRHVTMPAAAATTHRQEVGLPGYDNPATVEASATAHDSEPLASLGLRPTDAYDRYEAYLEKANTVVVAAPAAKRTRSQSDVRPHSVVSLAPTEAPSSSTWSATATGAGVGSGRLAGLMSRMKQGQTSGTERRITPAISGPICVTVADFDTATDQEDASRIAGPTWSSLVDPSILETMSDRERKRQEAIFELISTEGAYVRDLQLIVEVFYRGLLDILDNSSLEGVFANVEDILLFNTSLLSSLEDRQRNCRLYINRIGDILASQIPDVTVYRPYCMNQSSAIKLLQQIREENPAVAIKLQQIRDESPAVRHLDLSSFLLEPMQRLTRYPLLLRQVLHYSDDAEDTKDVQTALASAESVVLDVNEAVRRAENMERLRVLSEDLWIGGEGRLDLTAPTGFLGERRLIREGAVSKAKSGRKLQLVLCNDILVLIESRNLYRMPIPLHEALAKDSGSWDHTGFRIVQEFKKGGDVISLKANSAKDAQAWIGAINQARQVALEARNRAVKAQRRSSGIGY